jgi:hypothetical protein
MESVSWSLSKIILAVALPPERGFMRGKFIDKKLYVVMDTRAGVNSRTASIRFMGEWLKEIGFLCDKLVSIEEENGILILKVHENSLETYTKLTKGRFENKVRLIQIGSKKKGNNISPTFDLKGRWFENLGFRTGTVACAFFEHGVIRLKIIDIDNL